MAIFNIYKGPNSKGRLTSYGFCVLRIVSWCFTFVWDFMKISVFNSKSGNEYMVEMVMFHVQRAITPKVGKPELRLMCPAHSHMMLTFVWSFVTISQTVSVIKRTRIMVDMAMFTVQRVITLKVGNQSYICVKFRKNISNNIRVMERTRNYQALIDNRTAVLTFWV